MNEWQSSAGFLKSASYKRFMDSAEERQTSPEIMQAIASLSFNLNVAESIFSGYGFGKTIHLYDIVEIVTKNGELNPEDFYWGRFGNQWANSPQAKRPE